jgi:fructosamine-3-kinase
MFAAEADGLAMIEGCGTVRTPKVLGCGTTPEGSFLLLEFIEQGYRPDGFWDAFAEKLAAMHHSTATSFGLDSDNFIGALPQQNRPHQTWPEFYLHERLLPQIDTAKNMKRLQSTDYQLLESVCLRLPDLCPAEPPALVHGDLWSGNFLCSAAGEPVLIDPALAYCHREMDLAMSRLFGGFERPFYRRYEEVWPLEPGFEQRLPVYQLYYLLVHVNLFGGAYVGSLREAVRSII